ncbi:MAG: (d)CMP kinase, partial [Thermoplasmata archaeon]|nr:(d)CMP kinase [Thermoplasmata archaeon]
GSGKSTLAARLAGMLGLPYVNTGLMYRALTLRALREGVDPDDGPELVRLAAVITFDLDRSRTPPSLEIDGRPPEEALASPEVESRVSEVSGHPEVRALLRAEQRRLGQGGAVMEGRDIGSVVFPEADAKIFLLAAPGERATRRTREREELPASSPTARPTPHIAEAMSARDAQDAAVNPFIPAEDAVTIDTTGLDADAVYAAALEAVRRRIPG